jgi:ribosomal protein L5
MYRIFKFVVRELRYDLALKYNTKGSYDIPSLDAVHLSLNMQIKSSDFKTIKSIRLMEYLYEQKPNVYEHFLNRSNSLSIKITLRSVNAFKFITLLIEKFSKIENFNYFQIVNFSNMGVYSLVFRDINSLYFLGDLPYDYFNWKNMINVNSVINWGGLIRNNKGNFKLRSRAYWSMLGMLFVK